MGSRRNLKPLQPHEFHRMMWVQLPGEKEDSLKGSNCSKDFTIASSALGSALQSLGLHRTNEEVQDMLSLGGEAESGSISFPEFLTIAWSQMEGKTDDDHEEFWRMLDPDRRGSITVREYIHVICGSGGMRITEEDLDEMFRGSGVDRHA